MVRYYSFGAITALGLALLLVGCERPQGSLRSELGPKARSEPVLQADDDAKTVISKAVKAHGGEKAFSRWNCGYIKYKTQGGVVPALVGEVTNEDTFQLPGHFKRVTHLNAGGAGVVHCLRHQ